MHFIKAYAILGRIGRWAGWLLVPLLVLDLLTGYAIVFPRLFGGVLSRAVGYRLHIVVQPAFVALSVLHVHPHARAALRRAALPAAVVDPALALVGLGLVAFAIHLALLD